MKKIAIIHYSSPPIIAGVELVIKDHADMMASDGYYVKIISGKGTKYRDDIDFELIPEINPRNEKYLKMRGEFEKGKMPKEFESYKNKLKIKLVKALKNIDVCIIHQALTMHFNFALTQALLEIIEENKKIKFIHWTHDATFLDHNYKKKFHRYINQFPWKLITKMYSKVEYISITEFRRKQFAKFFKASGKKIVAVPNGVKIESFFKLDSEFKDIISNLNLFSCDLVACLPTRIVRRKNLEKAIEIIAEMKKLKLNIKYLITGAQDFQNPDSVHYFNDLKKLSLKLGVKKDVIFLSDYKLASGKNFNLEDINIQNLYLLSDFLLVPSVLEGFGLQLIEAGMTKTPVICNDILPFQEIAKNDAYIFKLNDNPKVIAKNIIKYLEKIPTSRLYRRTIKDYLLDNIYQERIKPLLRKKND